MKKIHELEVKLEPRDYIAMEAMKALMPIYWDEIIDEFDSGEELIKCHVETAYEYADAMLKERKKKDENSI